MQWSLQLDKMTNPFTT